MAICALCKKEKGTLRNSHFLPKAAWRNLRGPVDSPKPPVRIVLSEGAAFQNGLQITMELLCADCELLFSQRGENIISRLWSTQKGFPLLEKLKSGVAVSSNPIFDTYDPRKLGAEVVEAIYYFAVSVFWRAQVWAWGEYKDFYNKALGCKRERKFRKFLLGEVSLDEVYVALIVESATEFGAMMSFPVASRSNGMDILSFNLLGIKFCAHVGPGVPQETKDAFALFNSKISIMVSKQSTPVDFDKIALAVQRGVIPRGKLAKLAAP